MTYTTILFDLDGTLTDPQGGITRSVQYALRKLGIQADDLTALTPFIGPPLRESFAAMFGLSANDQARAVSFYREYFGEHGIFDNQVYDGIPTLLEELTRHGCRLALATSKPTVYAERIMDYFELRQYFDWIVGSNLDHSREAKAEVIAYALGLWPTVSLDQTVMIGDRGQDIVGAHTARIDSIAVRYGYGSEQEWEQTKPTHIVSTVSELRVLLLNT